MKAAQVHLTPELLLGVLVFPPETVLLGIQLDPFHDRVELVLAHPDLPEINTSPPVINPTWRLRPDGKPEFIAWGVT